MTDAGSKDAEATGFFGLDELILDATLIRRIAQYETNAGTLTRSPDGSEPFVVIDALAETQFVPSVRAGASERWRKWVAGLVSRHVHRPLRRRWNRLLSLPKFPS